VSQATGPVVFEARDVAKAYPGTMALRGVTFELRAGEVHALIGENGAGKSTLLRILAGIEPPTTGALVLDGQVTSFTSVRDAAAAGIVLIHQELQLFPDLSVEENLFVGHEMTTGLGLVDREAQRQRASDVLRRLGQPFDTASLVGSLPLGLQQIVEIARALVADARILLMDEPTSALTPAEVSVLFGVIRDLASRGVAIVYISHHLHEVLEIADRVTVLRDGAVVDRAPGSEIDVPWMISRMTGRASDLLARPGGHAGGAPVLQARGVSLAKRPGRTALENVDIDIRSGEVLGIYGLLGAGRTELFETLVGLHRDARGDVRLNGRSLSGVDIAGRVAAGLAMVPEDRKAAGLVEVLTVVQNITLSSLNRLVEAGVLRPAAEARASAPLVERLHVKAPSLEAPITTLSGGNQQKVVIARGVLSRPLVLLLDDPTRGVDVAAKMEILDTMRMLASDGMAIAFASSDVTEILHASDRVIVMARGRIRAELSREEATEEAAAAAASVGPAAREERRHVH
jgi:erythritol transport system ATP-binding protein